MLLGQNDSEVKAERKFIQAEQDFIQDVEISYIELGEKRGQNTRSRDFAAELRGVINDLSSTASIYRLNREKEVLIPRVSKISDTLSKLARLSGRPVKRWSGEVSKLKADAIEALLGGFPFADISYRPVGIDVTRRIATAIHNERPAWVPADDGQQRQDLKHLFDEGSTGLVKPSILPCFVETVCAQANAEALAGMITGIADLILAEPERKEVLIRHLVRRLHPLLTEIFTRLIPAKFKVLVNAMEADSDHASVQYLRFAAEEASLLLRELPVKPRTIMVARPLAAQCIEAVLKVGNLSERQAGLVVLAAKAPPAFGQALRSIVERIELQYAKDVNPTGMGRRTTRSYAAPAAWVLINDALDYIWPPEHGSLSKSTSAMICSIVESTYSLGEAEFERFGSDLAKFHSGRNTGIGSTGVSSKGGGSRKRLLVDDHIRLAATYRSARHQLNCALAFLERELREIRSRTDVNDPASLRLEATVRVLHSWREEMDWRLLHGAFEREQWRKAVPRFPQMSIGRPIEDRVRKIVDAAQRMIDDMLANMIRRQPHKTGAISTEGQNAGILAAD